MIARVDVPSLNLLAAGGLNFSRKHDDDLQCRIKLNQTMYGHMFCTYIKKRKCYLFFYVEWRQYSRKFFGKKFDKKILIIIWEN